MVDTRTGLVSNYDSKRRKLVSKKPSNSYVNQVKPMKKYSQVRTEKKRPRSSHRRGTQDKLRSSLNQLDDGVNAVKKFPRAEVMAVNEETYSGAA